MTIVIPSGRFQRTEPLCNGFCTCSDITFDNSDTERDLSTPTPTEPVRSRHTRFKQYRSRAIEERQKAHQRLMRDPKSAPSRKLQNGRIRYVRKCGRAAKFFKQQQELGESTALPPPEHCQVSQGSQGNQAEERLRRFVRFLKQRLSNIKAHATKNKLCSRLITYDDGYVFRTTRCYGRMTRTGCVECETTCGCGGYMFPGQKYCSAYCKNVAENIC